MSNTGDSTLDGSTAGDDRWEPTRTQTRPALVIAWCRDEPHRVGEVIRLPRGAVVELGRGEPPPEAGAGRRATLLRQRPGIDEAAPPLCSRKISRRQLVLRARGTERVAVENVGRCALMQHSRAVERTELAPGQTVEVQNQLVLLCCSRPVTIPDPRFESDAPTHPFGGADVHGIVGESPCTWELRTQLAFAARRNGHVLITGESGTGKELVARAIHALSARARNRLVARNAATFPETLIDAELFGNAADYPNPGMRARAGLIGEAAASTLFLDEIGELPPSLQAHLLRVLDSGGDYHRLGESTPRQADVRLVAATNRDPAELKHDLLARLTLRVRVAPLHERREDVPLLAYHLLAQTTAEDREIGARFCDDDGRPRVSGSLMAALVEHPYTLHVRELSSLLWRAIASSLGSVIELTEELRNELSAGPPPAATTPESLTPEQIEAALDRNAGVQERAWRDLGLKNRYVLIRLMKKYGLGR